MSDETLSDPESTPTKSGQTDQTDWREALGDLGTDPAFSDYKDEDFVQVPRAVAKSYVEAQKMVGREKMPRPQESWGDEEWGKFYADLGRPEKPDGYELPEVEIPEGFEVNGDLQKSVLEAAHREGLTPKQMKGLYESFMQTQVGAWKAQQETAQEKTQETISQLKKQYGTAYDAHIDLANRALRLAGGQQPEKLIEKLQGIAMQDGTPFLSHPIMVEVLGALGRQLHEGNLLPGEKISSTGIRTVEEKEREIEEFRAKHGAELVDESHPEHAVLTKRYNQLIESAVQ